MNATRRFKTHLIRKRSGVFLSRQLTHHLFDWITTKCSGLMTVSGQRLELLFFKSVFAPSFAFMWSEVLLSLGYAFQVSSKVSRHKKALLDKRQIYCIAHKYHWPDQSPELDSSRWQILELWKQVITSNLFDTFIFLHFALTFIWKLCNWHNIIFSHQKTIELL